MCVESILETVAAAGLWIRCCMMLLVLEIPQLPVVCQAVPCLAPGSLPVGFAACFWVVMQWHAVLLQQTHPDRHGWHSCVLKQVKTLLSTESPLRCFHKYNGLWGWSGLGVHTRNLRDSRSVLCSVPDFIFCLRQVTSVQ